MGEEEREEEGREAPAPSRAPDAADEEAQEEPADAEGRLSELNPMNLGDIFAKDPELARQGGGAAAKVPRSLQFAGSRLDDELDLRRLQVFVRIRPSVTAGAPRPAGGALEDCVHAASAHSIAIAPPERSQAYRAGDRGQTYSFTRVFDASTGQTEYYEATAAPLVRDLLRNPGHNSVVLAYGITAAGKTFTIEGTRGAPGVMPRALDDLFAGLARHAEPVAVRVSYYEVYNEQIYDLLDDAGGGPLGARVPLRLKEDAEGRVFVAGLSEAEVASAEEALGALRRGSRQRQRAETGLNYSSSRSHSIFTLRLLLRRAPTAAEVAAADGEGGSPREELVEERLGRLSFVDLAGSERAQRTGNVGVRLKESVAINSSLMTLGRCLEALCWNQQHREKGPAALRVTHLFRDALHGWGQVVLSVNVSPVSKDYDETAHVLKYAALATQIGTIQQAEAPRRTIKAVSPAIKKVKRKAALPPEARRQPKAKKSKKEQQPQGAAAEEEAAAAARVGSEDAPAAAEEAGAEGSWQWQLPELDQAAHTQGAAEEGSPEADDEGRGAALWAAGSDEGTPTTPQEAPDADDEVAQLQAQLRQLIADLQKAEERCVLVEAELLRDMEASYRERLQAEVEAVERKLEAGGGGKRGRKGGKARAGPDERDAEGAAAGEATRLRADLERTSAELSAAQARAAELESEAAQGRQLLGEERGRTGELEAALAAEQARGVELAAVLEAEQSRSQQLGAEAQAQQARAGELTAALAAEQQRTQQLQDERQGLTAELAAAQQASQQVAAQLEAERQAGQALQSSLAAAEQQVGELSAELEAARQQAAGLAADLQHAVAAAEAAQQAASEQYETELQAQLTQVEANRGMEVEMLEQQLERARKDNASLRQRLEAAMATLTALASPSKPLLHKMAQVAPAGNGRGAGGTPHDVALARARQAAAEEAEAAAAAGGDPRPRSTLQLARGRSRLAEAVVAPALRVGASQSQPEADAQPQPMQVEPASEPGAHAADCQQQQQQQPGDARPAEERAPGRRGRPRKVVAFAEGQAPAASRPSEPQLEQEQQGGADAPHAESKRHRRTTRAIAAVAAETEPAPEPGLSSGAAAGAAAAPVEPRRVRRMTRAALAAVPEVPEQRGDAQHARRGQQAPHLVVAPAAPAELLAPVPEDAEETSSQPAMEPPTAPPADSAALPAAGAAPEQDPAEQVQEPQQRQRGRGRRKTVASSAAAAAPGASPDENKENGGGQAGAAPPARARGKAARRGQAGSKGAAEAGPEEPGQEQAAAQGVVEAPSASAAAAAGAGDGKGRRRKKLLAPKESRELRSALGELNADDLALQRHAALKQQLQATSAPAQEGRPPARTRRQTQFYRL
eukprot:scaffold4.g4608.t1